MVGTQPASVVELKRWLKNFNSSGSCLAHKAVANAIANNPQSAAPHCIWTFVWFMVKWGFDEFIIAAICVIRLDG